MKNINLDKNNYIVNENEFNIINHKEFHNLILYEDYNLINRISGFINELSTIFENKIILNMFNVSHGGYIPINCSNNYDKIYINSINLSIEHFKYNLFFQNISNIYYENKETFELNNNYIEIYFKNEKNLKDITNLHTNENIILFYYDNKINSKNIYNLTNTDYYLYIPDKYYNNFYKEFKYYIKQDNFYINYDNLLHLTMIVKNAGNTFKNVLEQNLHLFDKWTILDTGSTDNTINIINEVLINKKGKLYQEPFIDFKQSRNKCLDLAGQSCKYIIMLDDTYIIKNKLRQFLEEIRSDQFANSYSLFINSDDVWYSSNRIIKSNSGLKYIYKIHEVITPKNNINVIIPKENSFIFDVRCDYMEKRTMNRKYQDIVFLLEELKEYPDDPRSLYYLAQTYNLLNKYELAYDYYLKRVNHPNPGFLQEKIDACFEAARKANFNLNKPWPECEELYLRAYNMDKTRSDSLYFIGIHYFLQSNNFNEIEENATKAYEYMKKCFILGYPEHCQYSLKPSLHFYFLPKFLAQLCYKFNDTLLGLKCCEIFLEKTQIINEIIPFKECYDPNDVRTMLSWQKIFKAIQSIPTNIKSVKSKYKNTDKPLLIFCADGGFKQWSGTSIIEDGVGGSETFTIEIAKYIQRSNKFKVIVFCNCEKEEIFENVEYIHLKKYFDFIFTYDINTAIISRYTEYLPPTLNSNIPNIHLIAHDIDFTCNIIPNTEQLKNIFTLSPWHADYLSNIYTGLKNKIISFGYGIDINNLNITKTEKNKIKQEYQITNNKERLQFIYSSFPLRGLLPLLQMWPSIVKKYNYATLIIHSNINDSWSYSVNRQEMDKINQEFHNIKHSDIANTIIYKGWTNKKELYESWKTADICFYTCTFNETFCLTCLEAAITHTLVITTDLAALKTTVDDRGVLIPTNTITDFYEPSFQENALNILFDTIENKNLINNLIDKNYKYALQLNWSNRANEFLKII
jgi:hypothetical protein